jgi:hypothetical protein
LTQFYSSLGQQVVSLVDALGDGSGQWHDRSECTRDRAQGQAFWLTEASCDASPVHSAMVVWYADGDSQAPGLNERGQRSHITTSYHRIAAHHTPGMRNQELHGGRGRRWRYQGRLRAHNPEVTGSPAVLAGRAESWPRYLRGTPRGASFRLGCPDGIQAHNQQPLASEVEGGDEQDSQPGSSDVALSGHAVLCPSCGQVKRRQSIRPGEAHPSRRCPP